MRVLVTGTRDPKDEQAARAAIREAFEAVNRMDPGPHTLIHGNARGIDTLAESTAIRFGFAKGIYRFPAEWAYWNHLGAVMRDEGMKKSAGMHRNREMLETLPPDIVLAFPGPDSKGTWGMLRLLDGSDIPVLIHKVD